MADEKEEILTDPVKQIICAKCGKSLDVTGLAAFSKFRCGHCQAVQTVPAKLGNFILLELLGRGGMGAVYRAVDQALGRPVAIKVMLRSVAADRVFFEQFKREARAAAALSHPNIVQVFSLDEEKGQSYIVMELLSGGRLDHVISKKKRLDEAEMLKIGLDVAEGLSAAHSVGLIHDDIKPENILFDSKGFAKIVDFGLARFRGKGPQAGQNEIWGTPYYIAPEKVLRKTSDFRSDMYSLGCTLFHALTGRPPFEGETAVDVVKARIQGPAPDVRTFRPEVRPAVAALLAALLEREPEKRPATYTILIEEFRKLAGVEPPKTGPASGTEPPQKSTKILIKGKKRLTTSAPDASAPAEGAALEGDAKPKKGTGRRVLILIGIILVLAGVIGGLVVFIMGRASRKAAAVQLAQLVKDQKQAVDYLAVIQNATTGVLAETELFFFYEVEATNRLAQARAILDAMGDHAKLVTLPVLPNDGDLARRVEGPVITSFSNLTNLEALCAEADAIQSTISNAKRDDPAVKTGLARMKAILGALDPMKMALGESQKTAAKVVADAAEFIKQAESVREAGVKAAARDAADAEARKKKEAEEAEKKRLQAEKDAKIAAEREKVKMAWNDSLDKIRQNQFGEAADGLKGALGRLETDEGKADAKTAEDRCRIMQEMKDYIAAGLKEKPLRWGWFTPGGQIDISGANENGILVRGKTEPWTAVDVRQMLKFIEVYVKSEEAREKKGKKGWARLNLGAAIYCYLQGERAYPVARGYADVAQAQDSKLEDEIKRLMPDLPKGDS